MKNLSIIIPHYNIPDLLCRLLKSIPEREDIEAIVVDDCSSKPLNQVREYVSSRTNISLSIAECNGGAGKCRNLGLELAQGKWVMFADADDYFLDEFLDIISPYFNSIADIVFFTATSKDIETGNIGIRHLLLNETVCNWSRNRNYIKAELNIRYKLNGPVCKLIKMELIKNNAIKFDQVRVSNDELFSAKTGFYAKTIDACEIPIYCITSRPGSLIEVISEENFMIRLEVFIRKYHFLKEHLSKREFEVLDLSAQEKIFSMIQNRYGFSFCKKVIQKLLRGKIRFVTKETLKPQVMIDKIKLAVSLSQLRKKEKKFLVRSNNGTD